MTVFLILLVVACLTGLIGAGALAWRDERRATRVHRRDNPDAFGDEPRKVRAARRAVPESELRALRPANTPIPVHEAEEA